jgi:predicted metal-dependent peptidase
MLSAEDRITKAYVALMQNKQTMLYSGLLMVGKVEVKDDCRTACTNGRDVIYGRGFVQSLTDPELRGLILHETMHKMYQHLFTWKKIHEENHKRANRACDYVINLEIYDLGKESGFIKLPSGGLLNEGFRGLDSGEVFKLLEQIEGDDDTDGDSLDEHDWDGAEELSQEDKDQLAKDIDGAIRTGSLLAGKQGGDMSRSFEQLMQSQVDWKEQLRDFVSTVCAGKGDSTWAKPNRRWLQLGMYMPSQISESVASLVVGVDTSGSISQEAITKALSEVVAICDNVLPEKIDLLYWDTDVASHEIYTEDNYSGLVSSTKPAGGGGTDVSCVFNYIEKHKLDPQCVIVITDGYTPYPATSPYPTIWVMTENGYCQPPFGSIIKIK